MQSGGTICGRLILHSETLLQELAQIDSIIIECEHMYGGVMQILVFSGKLPALSASPVDSISVSVVA